MTQFEIVTALSNLRPGAVWTITGNTYESINWQDTVQAKPTEQEVNDQITADIVQAPFVACSEEAKKRIADTDWSVLPDVNISNKAEFEAYRAQLRTLIITPVENPTFPTEPQPVWI